jgi:hypothetical protein
MLNRESLLECDASRAISDEQDQPPMIVMRHAAIDYNDLRRRPGDTFNTMPTQYEDEDQQALDPNCLAMLDSEEFIPEQKLIVRRPLGRLAQSPFLDESGGDTAEENNSTAHSSLLGGGKLKKRLTLLPYKTHAKAELASSRRSPFSLLQSRLNQPQMKFSMFNGSAQRPSPDISRTMFEAGPQTQSHNRQGGLMDLSQLSFQPS